MDVKEKCIFCGNEDAVSQDADGERIFKKCDICGNYIFPLTTSYLINNVFGDSYGKQYDKEKLVAYLYHNKIDERYAFVGTESAFEQYKIHNPKTVAYLVTPESVENWYPKTIDEKLDKVLLKIKALSKYDGDTVVIGFDKARVLFFTHIKDCSEEVDEEIITQQQIEFIIDALIELNYIVVEDWDNIKARIMSARTILHIKLTPKGLTQIYYLQKTHVINKEVFVAMSFHESANLIREAIRKGINEAHFSTLFMDEVVHNHQIVPEMLRLIKESKFMIMDITQPNFGAYYEAGYAQGLGKEVIITCSREVWDKKDFSCNKDKDCRYIEIASKPHFDIAQKQVLVWKDYADLTKQLAEWIKLIIG